MWIAVARGRGPFTDEGDNLAVGRLLADGWVLYRDVFSHHHPLPYWLSAALWPLLGESVFAYRLALLAAIGAAGLAIGTIRDWRFAIAIAVAAYVSASTTVNGTFFTFSALAAPAVVVIFVYTLRALLAESPAPGTAIALGIAGSAALLLDPLLAPFVAGSWMLLLARRRSRLAAGKSAIVIAATAGIAVSYLFATESVAAYVIDVLRFNREVYDQYRPIGDLGAARGATLLATGLGAFSMLPPVLGHEFWDPASFDQSLTGGLGMRLAMLIAGLCLLLRGRFSAAGYVYVAGAVLLATHHEWEFHALPSLFVALAALPLAVSGEMRPRERRWLGATRFAVHALLLVALVSWQTSAIRATRVMPEDPWGGVEGRAQATAEEAAKQGVDRVATYPDDLYLYFFERVKPLGRYMFLTPWVAEVATPAILRSIRSERGLVRLDVEGSVWGVRVEDFVRPLTEGCATECCWVDEDLYLTGPACALAASPREAE